MNPDERDLALGKIDEWRKKGNSESDPFNKYVSLFTAYNILYTLYKKTKSTKDFRDSEGVISPLQLVPDRSKLFRHIESDLREYAKGIPKFREEYWSKKDTVGIGSSLKEALRRNDASRAVEMMVKWLYRVRCNLVHGEKNYNDVSQQLLLSQSSKLLDKYLLYVIDRYHAVYNGVSVSPQQDEILGTASNPSKSS